MSALSCVYQEREETGSWVTRNLGCRLKRSQSQPHTRGGRGRADPQELLQQAHTPGHRRPRRGSRETKTSPGTRERAWSMVVVRTRYVWLGGRAVEERMYPFAHNPARFHPVAVTYHTALILIRGTTWRDYPSLIRAKALAMNGVITSLQQRAGQRSTRPKMPPTESPTTWGGWPPAARARCSASAAGSRSPRAYPIQAWTWSCRLPMPMAFVHLDIVRVLQNSST